MDTQSHKNIFINLKAFPASPSIKIGLIKDATFPSKL